MNFVTLKAYVDNAFFSTLRFADHVRDLFKLLSNRMAGSTVEPLSQLLLRLDYNYWFSFGANLTAAVQNHKTVDGL